MLECLNKYASLIQALSSVLLVFVTIRYIVITKKLVHTPHDCFIRPVKLNVVTGDRLGWSVSVKNFSPGNAFHVAVEAIAVKSAVPDEGNPGWYWVSEGFCKALGLSLAMLKSA